MPHQNQQLCKKSNDKLGRLIQYIIYFFNNNEIRSNIINSAIKDYGKKNIVHYMGTISFCGDNIKDMKLCEPYDVENLKTYFNTTTAATPVEAYYEEVYENPVNGRGRPKKILSKSEFMKKHDNNKKSFVSNSIHFENKNVCTFIKDNKDKIREKPITVFTCCYHYGKANVHFISVIYISKLKEMLVFDSGIDVYPEGETHMLPLLQKAFKEAALLKTTAQLGKSCYRHRYIAKDEPAGFQYAGSKKFRDAFCQTWSLWYIVNFIKKKKMIRKVCQLHPSNREIFLIKDFIVPLLAKNPEWSHDILEDHSEDLTSLLFPDVASSHQQFMKALSDYSTGCLTRMCKNQKQTTVCLMNRLK